VNVAIVFFGLTPAEGGTFTFQETLVEEIRRRASVPGLDLHLYSIGGARLEGVTPIRFSRLSRSRRLGIVAARDLCDRLAVPRPRWRTALDATLARDLIDVVWFASQYAEPCELPTIATVLDLEHLHHPWFPEVSQRGEWERREHAFHRVLPKATGVIVANQAAAADVAGRFGVPAERLLCMPHPTPAFALAAAAADTPPIEAVRALGVEPPYVLYPAQFWPHKNHATLIEAMQSLPGYGLVLVGSDKGQLGYVQELAHRADVHTRVRFPGFVSTEQLVALYAHAHALAFASWFGPENLPPLEAFALGCPVVASRVPGAEEQLGGAALLVDPTDARGFAEAVLALEEPALRQRLVAAGRARAAERTVAQYVTGVLEFLQRFAALRATWS
jgi:glycosyltransferase involved in cell wall biosynthesis